MLLMDQMLPMAGDALKANNEHFWYSLDSAECQNSAGKDKGRDSGCSCSTLCWAGRGQQGP